MSGRAWAWFVALVSGGATGSVLGQGQFSQGSVRYVVSFVEYDAAAMLPILSPNGVIGSTEAAMVVVQMQYAPPNGTPITFSTTLLAGSSGSGTMGGFWGGYFS